ncbi:hypothetical protein QVD99_000730 [Batrachochytrium dendrobatidis]|nr:hypothetical protein O5D80_003579 [Batrachochytrium dendrobatidis]KAK5673275.1 hypothetical protein QVD99_000730 [Batrachochytrium dendrobatidis]
MGCMGAMSAKSTECSMSTGIEIRRVTRATKHIALQPIESTEHKPALASSASDTHTPILINTYSNVSTQNTTTLLDDKQQMTDNSTSPRKPHKRQADQASRRSIRDGRRKSARHEYPESVKDELAKSNTGDLLQTEKSRTEIIIGAYKSDSLPILQPKHSLTPMLSPTAGVTLMLQDLQTQTPLSKTKMPHPGTHSTAQSCQLFVKNSMASTHSCSFDDIAPVTSSLHRESSVCLDSSTLQHNQRHALPVSIAMTKPTASHFQGMATPSGQLRTPIVDADSIFNTPQAGFLFTIPQSREHAKTPQSALQLSLKSRNNAHVETNSEHYFELFIQDSFPDDPCDSDMVIDLHSDGFNDTSNTAQTDSTLLTNYEIDKENAVLSAPDTHATMALHSRQKGALESIDITLLPEYRNLIGLAWQIEDNACSSRTLPPKTPESTQGIKKRRISHSSQTNMKTHSMAASGQNSYMRQDDADSESVPSNPCLDSLVNGGKYHTVVATQSSNNLRREGHLRSAAATKLCFDRPIKCPKALLSRQDLAAATNAAISDLGTLSSKDTKLSSTAPAHMMCNAISPSALSAHTIGEMVASANSNHGSLSLAQVSPIFTGCVRKYNLRPRPTAAPQSWMGYSNSSSEHTATRRFQVHV